MRTEMVSRGPRQRGQGRWPTETPWAWCLSFFAAVVVALLGAAFGGLGHRTAMLVVFGLLTAAVAATARIAAAPLVAGTCWCFYDGFFVNRQGHLHGQPVADLRPLLVIAVAALLGWAAGCVLRRTATPSAYRRGRRTDEANPLLRPTDHARARLHRRRRRLLIAVAVLALGAGGGTYLVAAEQAATAQAREHQVAARTLVRATPPAVHGSPRGAGPVVRVPVSWRDSAGRAHTAIATVPTGRPAGTPVSIWVNAADTAVDAPATPADLAIMSLLATLAAAGLGGAVVAGGSAWARRRLDRRDWRDWERGWSAVEPDWSGRRRRNSPDRDERNGHDGHDQDRNDRDRSDRDRSDRDRNDHDVNGC